MFSGVDFKTLEGIPSIPLLFFDFKSVTILLISRVVVGLKYKEFGIGKGKNSLKLWEVGGSLLTSLVPTSTK